MKKHEGCEDWFFCDGYQTEMKLWHCLENQLSDYCLPGFPCHECPAALTIKPAPRRRALRVTYPPEFANMTPAVRRSILADLGETDG